MILVNKQAGGERITKKMPNLATSVMRFTAKMTGSRNWGKPEISRAQ